MATRKVGAREAFEWIGDAVRLLLREPRVLLGAAACMLGAWFALGLAMQPLVGDAATTEGRFANAALGLLSWLLLTPMAGGFLQVIDALENGRTARALDVFAPYRADTVGRFAALAMVFAVVYLAGVMALALIAGPEARASVFDVLMATGAPRVQRTLGDFEVYAIIPLASTFVVLLCAWWAIGIGQVALARRAAVPALADGVIGTWKNLVPFFLVLLVLMACSLAFSAVFFALASLLAMVASVVGTWVLYALTLVYVAVGLVVYAVVFALGYYLWRDVCGDGDPAIAVTAA